MSLKYVLFDMDGTLLPMDQDLFIRKYFESLSAKLSLRGYEPRELVDAMWKGIYAMMYNDGTRTNEKAFWDVFGGIYGEKAYRDIVYFDEYYRFDFDSVKAFCGYDPKAAETLKKIKALGLKTVLATNPVFPSVAVEKRISWAGISHKEFEFYTSYENVSHCKPDPGYYKEIAEKLGAEPRECLMVGNDTTDDMAAEQLGMKVFLLTDNLINKKNADVNMYPNGGFDELYDYVCRILR
ncbi:MAG: HAD family hydrolase [Ruminococcaceae bacterium]|nr:HAD family hydrolase [Oscillospiraceae bacterium]